MLNLQCQDCGAVLRVAPSQRTASCVYCASASVIERPGASPADTPKFALAFVLSHDDAMVLARQWQKRQGFFRHAGIRKARVENIHGVYLPAYLYSGLARSAYSAAIGEWYWTGSGKNRQRHTEWVGIQGYHVAYVRDVVVTASRGISNLELDTVEPFDLRALHRHTPALIAGWAAEEPSMTVEESLAFARHEAGLQVGQMLSGFMPGDEQKDLSYDMRLYYESFDQVLTPIWVLAIRYDAKKPPLRLIINGQTGKLHGEAPRSWLRIILVIVGVILALLALLSVFVGLFMLVALLSS